MRRLACNTILAAAIAGCGLFVAAQANAHDGDRWDRWDYRHHHGRWHDDDRLVARDCKNVRGANRNA